MKPVELLIAMAAALSMMSLPADANERIWQENFTDVYTAEHVKPVNREALTGNKIPDIVAGFSWYIQKDADIVALMDGATGDVRWTFPGRDELVDVIEVHDLNADLIEDVLVGTTATVYALDGANGQPLWSALTGGVQDIVTLPDVNGNGSSDVVVTIDQYPTIYKSSVVALDGRDGQIIWAIELPSYKHAVDVDVFDDVDKKGMPDLIIGTHGQDGIHSVLLLSTENRGQMIWEMRSGSIGDAVAKINRPTSSNRQSSLGLKPLRAHDVITIPDGATRVTRLDGETGEIQWEYIKSHPQEHIKLPPTVMKDVNRNGWDDVVFTMYDEEMHLVVLLCLEGKDGQPLWKYVNPDYQADFAGTHTGNASTQANDINSDGVADFLTTGRDATDTPLRIFGMLAVSGADGKMLYYHPLSNEPIIGITPVTDINGNGAPHIAVGFNVGHFPMTGAAALIDGKNNK